MPKASPPSITTLKNRSFQCWPSTISSDVPWAASLLAREGGIFRLFWIIKRNERIPECMRWYLLFLEMCSKREQGGSTVGL